MTSETYFPSPTALITSHFVPSKELFVLGKRTHTKFIQKHAAECQCLAHVLLHARELSGIITSTVCKHFEFSSFFHSFTGGVLHANGCRFNNGHTRRVYNATRGKRAVCETRL